ncbi:MAG TPA: RNA 2',3'-cyclic phosphodiesterase [Anaerolineales bacterium]|jgi:2'-5' RNA ligase|nr:RNA 2',3'-cyclic phosphodiesterase [Anaerolineales bacterium]
MGLLRAFLASELPSPLQDSIQSAIDQLCKSLGGDLVRWVPAHNIHLTLKFLGDVSPANLDLIKQMLAREAAQFPCFDVQVEGIGSYPNSRRPRVLWVGLSSPASLMSLQHAIETAASRLGYEAEERGFSPHLTIGRVRQNVSAADLQKIRSVVDGTRVGHIGMARVDAIHLFKSDLQPSGSVYTKLFSAPLGTA